MSPASPRPDGSSEPGRPAAGEPQPAGSAGARGRLVGLRARFELGRGESTVGLTAVLIVGVLVLQLVMIGSYVGALHAPRARDVPLAVAGPPAVTGPLVRRLAAGDALSPRPVADLEQARAAIDDREVYGALLPGARGDRLLIASAAGVSVARLLPAALRQAEPPGRRLVVQDVKPLPPEDPSGLSPFYLVVGWLVGGYVGATVLGLARGGVARGRRLAFGRLAALAAYSVASGVLGALVVQQLVGVLEGSFLALAAAGALIVFATGAATAALQGVLGIVGTALAVLLFVALGNPSSGGPLATELLMPEPWRAIGPLLPPGAGATLTRNIAYFGSAAVAGPLLVLGVYAVVGSLVVLAVGGRRRPDPAGEAEAVAGTALAA